MFIFRKTSSPWDGSQDQSEDSTNHGISGFQVSYNCNKNDSFSNDLYLVIGACYATSMWADAFTHKEERKNPADFANDE